VANRFDSRRVHVVPYFTDVPPRVADPPAGRPRLFCAARLVPEKGLHVLVDALRRVPDVALTIAGDGPERARLKGLVALGGLDDRVTFTGWLEPDAVSHAIADATAVVVPSLWPEPFGITGIEAMAHARPVIAFDVGGVREWLVDRETGLAVAPGDAAALAAAIARLAADRELATRLGRRGRECAQGRFTARVHVESLLRVVRRACAGGVPA
jgi:glycosyltransferase involved in cell wall biosynthesis